MVDTLAQMVREQRKLETARLKEDNALFLKLKQQRIGLIF